MLDALCLLAMPHAGAGHLLRLCESLPEVRPLPGLFETLAERLEPAAAFDSALSSTRAAGRRVLVFRLSPDMLPADTAEAAIASQRGVRLVLVVRRQIDAYVSWRKGIEERSRGPADGPKTRSALDVTDFGLWMDQQERWFDHWRNWLNRRFLPQPVLRYETDIDLPPQATLKRLAAAAAQVGVTLRVPQAPNLTALTRQDRTTAAADRVIDWPEFSRGLVSRGLERRAFGYPI